ncbi:probable cytochrome P450 28a5 [Musca domestica]|uniref:Probable cytochrome P450 28a5 n=1 Tax=Musca domestica TaxID=7370 RepID=A0A1I8M473_MUSDO|nr:probable cytochrome P450 28a5 [Musca domestica]
MLAFALGLACAILLLLYLFLVWPFNYWKQRGVNGPKPRPFVGNYPSGFTQKRSIACDIHDIYETYKKSDDFVGIYNCRTPQLLVINPKLIRRVLVTDFKHFHDNDASTMADKNTDFILGNNPFVLTGEEWKERRAEITPGFTTNRIKTVFPVTNKVCQTMIDFIRQQMKIGNKDGIDGKDLSLRYTCEVVTDCVLGLSADAFANRPCPILDMTKNIFDQSFVFIAYILLTGMLPWIKKVKKLRFIPKPVEEFFVNLMENSLSMRKEQKQKGVNENRVDFINYMLHLQEKKNLQIPELTAHTMTFLLDGFETTANVLSHCLLLLGRDPNRQQILRNEILAKLDSTDDFDTIMDLPYLDACIHETLRLFPPGAFSTKLCTESIEFENRNGKTLKINEGTTVVLPIHALMADEEHYENASSFEPERFLDGGLKKYRDQGLYLAFGDGPRICLGMRFALTQIKGALVEIVRNFEIRVNSKTRTDNRFDPTYSLMRLDGGIWLEFDSIN